MPMWCHDESMSDDVRAIIDLTLRYAWALDTKHIDDLDNVFAPDATGMLRGRECIGRDAIKERIGSAIGRFVVTQHITTNHQVVVDGDAATCRCQLQSQHVMETGNVIIGGYYEDTLTRTPDGWRITHRLMEQTWMSQQGT
jgi:ketosteroid isomerase-like protein